MECGRMCFRSQAQGSNVLMILDAAIIAQRIETFSAPKLWRRVILEPEFQVCVHELLGCHGNPARPASGVESFPISLICKHSERASCCSQATLLHWWWIKNNSLFGFRSRSVDVIGCVYWIWMCLFAKARGFSSCGFVKNKTSFSQHSFLEH